MKGKGRPQSLTEPSHPLTGHVSEDRSSARTKYIARPCAQRFVGSVETRGKLSSKKPNMTVPVRLIADVLVVS